MGNGITNSQPVVPFSTESSFSKNGSELSQQAVNGASS